MLLQYLENHQTFNYITNNLAATISMNTCENVGG